MNQPDMNRTYASGQFGMQPGERWRRFLERVGTRSNDFAVRLSRAQLADVYQSLGERTLARHEAQAAAHLRARVANKIRDAARRETYLAAASGLEDHDATSLSPGRDQEPKSFRMARRGQRHAAVLHE